MPEPEGYVRHEHFYRLALGGPGGRLRLASKLAQHVPDMLRYRRVANNADVVHFQWLPVQHLDVHLLPAGRPLVLTAHDVLPREPRPGQLAAQKRLYERFDAIVVHSQNGRQRLVAELGVAEERVHVIPHGAFTHLAGGAASAAATAAAGRSEPVAIDPPSDDRLVVLCFGLMRPYKGIGVLLDAWRGANPGQAPVDGAELWIAGMPKMDVSALRAASPANVRWDARFVGDDGLSAYFARADLVVLPYLEADQSGVLYTALAFGKPLLLSDVGGFPELADTGAAKIVPAGDAGALRQALQELLADREALERMGAAALAAAEGHYSWSHVAHAHIALYEQLLRDR